MAGMMPVKGGKKFVPKFALFGLLIALVVLSLRPSHANETHLMGSWDGADWGAIEVDETMLGTYTSTFNGGQGILHFKYDGLRDGVYVFSANWRESGPTSGHPLRRGTLTLKIRQLKPTSGEVVWESTDGDNTRAKSGRSVWTRK